VAQGAGETRVEVRASVIAVDRQGGIAAMIEGGARARTAARGAPAAQLTSRALDAAAKSLAEDLAGRLLTRG
jgi:carbon monoxide dehydrogenase subunit G